MGKCDPKLACPHCGEKWRIRAELLCVMDRPVGFVHSCESCGSEWTDDGVIVAD